MQRLSSSQLASYVASLVNQTFTPLFSSDTEAEGRSGAVLCSLQEFE